MSRAAFTKRWWVTPELRTALQASLINIYQENANCRTGPVSDFKWGLRGSGDYMYDIMQGNACRIRLTGNDDIFFLSRGT